MQACARICEACCSVYATQRSLWCWSRRRACLPVERKRARRLVEQTADCTLRVSPESGRGLPEEYIHTALPARGSVSSLTLQLLSTVTTLSAVVWLSTRVCLRKRQPPDYWKSTKAKRSCSSSPLAYHKSHVSDVTCFRSCRLMGRAKGA